MWVESTSASGLWWVETTLASVLGQGATSASRLCLSQVCANYAWYHVCTVVECGVISVNRFPAKFDVVTTFSFEVCLDRFQE